MTSKFEILINNNPPNGEVIVVGTVVVGDDHDFAYSIAIKEGIKKFNLFNLEVVGASRIGYCDEDGK